MWGLWEQQEKEPAPPPAIGSAFAFPLADGRYGACRVVRGHDPDIGVLVAGSAWIGSKVPRANDPALRPILQLTHGSENKPCLMWIDEPRRRCMIPIGRIEPSEEERSLYGAHGSWCKLACEPLVQWRWDNGLRELLSEEDRRAALQDLRRRRFFLHWEYPSRLAIAASRLIMWRTVRKLVRLGPNASEEKRTNVILRCIASFNALDFALEFIETGEREDIHGEVNEIAYVCGLLHREDLLDGRHW